MIKTGNKWGALECTYAGFVEQKVMGLDADGQEYVKDRMQVKAYKLKCSCGNEITVPQTQFMGKRMMRDCGCGSAGFSGEYSIITFSSNSGVKGHLQDLAKYDGKTVSHVINEALREYFERRAQKGNGHVKDWGADGVEPRTGLGS